MGQQLSRAGHRRSMQNATELPCLVSNAAPEPMSRRREAAVSTSPHTPQTVDLEGYVRAALFEVHGCAPEQIFRPSKRFPKPQLRKGVMNRILTFAGSFNPPHMGHKLLLTHTFFRSNSEDVVAAFISPNSTKFLKNKLRNEADALILTRRERVRLWNDPFLTPWSWVSPFPHEKNDDFEDALLRAVEADGFKIEFFLVVGGDHIEQAAANIIKDSVEPIVVFSDGLRSIPRAPDGSPFPLVDYGEWQKTEAPDLRLLGKVQRGELFALAMLHLLYPVEVSPIFQFSTNPREQDARASSVLQECLRVSGCPWVCVHLHEEAFQVHFVPARNVAGAGTESELSATGIRAIIRDVDPAQRVPVLTNLVLNPQVLSDLVDEKEKKKASKDAKHAAPRSQTLS